MSSDDCEKDLSRDRTEPLSQPGREPPLLQPGDLLGDRYLVVRFLARGGMGEVYEAVDQHLQGKHIALKTLRPEIAAEPEMRSRFEREVLLAREVNHRNVCPTFDLFRLQTERGPLLCLTMRLLHGESLLARLDRLGPMPPETVLPIARQLAAGLDAAHSAGVIHRDFKPGNIVLEDSGGELHASITDFGLSRFHSDDTIARVGASPGTPGYIAPELFEGRVASPSSDIYSFGVVLHQMLTGRLPGAKSASVHVPADWDRVIQSCIHPNPAARSPSATEALSPIDLGRRSRPFTFGRRRLPIALAAAALMAAVPFAIGPIDRALHPLPQRRFVAVNSVPAGQSAAAAANLSTIADAVAAQLIRAESHVKDLLIIGPRENGAALGANLLLELDFDNQHMLRLDLLDAASRKRLRHRALRLEPSAVARLPDEAAAAAADLLDIPAPAGKASDPLAGVTPGAYQAFTTAEELFKQPNDSGLAQAIEKYQEALELAPDFALGYAKIARAYARQYATAHKPASLLLAETNAERALEHNPEMPAGLLSRAQVLTYSGHPGEALTLLNQALKLDPGNPDMLYAQALAFHNLHRPADEEKTYRLIIQQRPNYHFVYNQLGSFLYRNGQYAKSAEAFQMASQVAPRQALPLANLGAAYYALGRRAEAAAAFHESLARGPTEIAFQNLGNMAFEDHDYRKALGYYGKAAELKPNEDLTWRNIADSHAVLGDRAAMLENYGKAATVLSQRLSANPKNGFGWATLAFYHAKIGRAADAAADLRQADANGATDIQSQFLEAQALAVLGRAPQAIDLLASCVKQGLSPVEVDLALDLKTIRSDPRYLRRMKSQSNLKRSSPS